MFADTDFAAETIADAYTDSLFKPFPKAGPEIKHLFRSLCIAPFAHAIKKGPQRFDPARGLNCIAIETLFMDMKQVLARLEPALRASNVKVYDFALREATVGRFCLTEVGLITQTLQRREMPLAGSFSFLPRDFAVVAPLRFDDVPGNIVSVTVQHPEHVRPSLPPEQQGKRVAADMPSFFFGTARSTFLSEGTAVYLPKPFVPVPLRPSQAPVAANNENQPVVTASSLRMNVAPI